MGDKFIGGVSMIGPTVLSCVIGGVAVSVDSLLSLPLDKHASLQCMAVTHAC